MAIDIRLPNITATNTSGQVAQLQSYMYQMVQQLNWALNTINSAESGDTSNVVLNKQKGEITPEEAQDTFDSIKSLIIKSADIVNAYEETIKNNFNGTYFADSDFGTYLQETKASIEENSQGLTATYEKVESITNDEGTGTLDTEIKESKAYIRRGFLGKYKTGEKQGQDAYGVAVGETDDNGIYNAFAWFTADRLSFFDENNDEVAYISNQRLYITDAIFLGTVQFGGYMVDTSDGLAFTWIGG